MKKPMNNKLPPGYASGASAGLDLGNSLKGGLS